MEELLNKLIEKGWKPYGIEKDDIEVCSYDKDRKKISIGYMNWETPSKGDYDWLFLDLRQLTAKESGLWQFCCDKGLIKMKEGYYWQNIALIHSEEYDYTDYQYWILESSLIDEDELEDFLIENIKV